MLEKKGDVKRLKVKAEAAAKLHEAPCQSLAGHDDIFRVKEAKRKDLNLLICYFNHFFFLGAPLGKDEGYCPEKIIWFLSRRKAANPEVLVVFFSCPW